MSCTNCFNGCAGGPTSDKCVKYTGSTIAELGITNGDSLSAVENAITTYLLTALDGSGIVPYIDNGSLCALVSNYLPGSGTITLINVIDALIQSVCDLQEQVTTLSNSITTLNANYTIGCLTGVTSSSDTHNILQAVITKLCTIETDLNSLELNVDTNYVKVSEIDTYIENYITTSGSSVLISAKMVPYVAVEYYGSLTNFDASGAGLGDWKNIYLCNGNNGTPDKRGRVAVGAITGMGGGVLDSAVDPAITTNPNYALLSKQGANAITLNSTQMPSHTHTTTVSTDGAHTHTITGYIQSGSNDGSGGEAAGYFDTKITSSSGSHTHTVTNSETGGGGSHSNIQPSLGCYYIIYLP